MARGPGAQRDAQLQRLGDAAVRVLARDGLPALTFRTVAAEAGVSPGRVQHYARTSHGLVALTFHRIQELAQQRIREAAAALPAPSPTDLIAATLRSLIPRDDHDRVVMQVAATVELHALTDSDLAEQLRAGRSELIGFLAEQLRDAVPERPDDNPSPTRAATMLLATAEGLSSLTMSRAIDGTEAVSLLDESIQAALGHATAQS